MRNISFILVFALFGLVSTLHAQSSNKIGYIDLQSVIQNSKAGKAAKTSFESEFKKKRLIIENKAKILAQEEQDFISQSALMDDEAKKRRAEDIQQKKKELTRLRDDFREVLQKKDFELTQKILKELESVIKTIGSKEGYSLIVEKTESGVIYGSDSVDITQKVISAYDKTN
ncbi:MAG: OmpH/Skp family outer membrane protein [Planctomycetota bacterium]|jgi:outer membrane protein